MYFTSFSYDLTNIDSLFGQVIGIKGDKVFIRASVPHSYDVQVFGFAYYQTTAAIGSTVSVSIVKEFPDGQFRFRVESIQDFSTMVPLKGKRELPLPASVA